MIRDINGRKQAEEALGASELRYRRLFESAKDGILILDAETGMVVDVNPFLISLLGFSLEQFLGKAIWELGFFKDIVASEDNFAKLREEEYIRYDNLPLETADGRRIEVEFVSNVYLVNSSRVIQCNVRDITARKQAEEELRWKTAFLEAQVNSSLDGVIVVNQQGRKILQNQQAAELLKIPRHIADDPDDEKQLRWVTGMTRNPEQFFEKVVHLNSHTDEISHDEIELKDGAILDRYSSPVAGKDGKYYGRIWTFRDITERKRAEEALRESKHFAESIAENSTSYIYLFDLETYSVTYSNRSMAELLGYSEARVREFGDNIIASLMHPEDLPRIAQRLAHYAEVTDSRIFEYEYRAKHANGGWRWIWGREKVFSRRPNGAAWQLMGSVQDITERKHAQQALSLALERLQLALKVGKIGTWDLDLLTTNMKSDAQMLALYGMSPENVESGVECWFDTIHPDDLASVKALYEEVMSGQKESLDTEFRVLRKNDGRLRFMRTMGVTLRDESARPIRMIGINWDVTEERLRENELAEALAQEKELSEKARAGDRSKSEFLAVMSHEIRTPMNGILGFSELLAGTPDLPVDCLDYVKIITSSGEALLRILDDILDFSRLEAGGLKVEKSLFSSREILHDIRTLLAPHAGEKRLEFHITMDASISDRLRNDAGRLRQVLINLAANAIKFTERGSITIGMRPSSQFLKTGEPCVDFFVRDTGPGIPGDELRHIFEPFAQADSSISRRYGGTGLGLSISRNLVELMGGKLTVQSKVGAGSEFCVTLPGGVPESAMPAIADSAGDGLDEIFATKHPLHILLVEDDRVNLKLMLMMMRKLGYEPLIAKDGIEAVEIYRQERPDCILMDLQMPRKDGLQATLEIREMERSTPAAAHAFISALTANIVAEDRSRCFEVGMDGYMNKPIKRSLLAKTLKQASDAKEDSR